MSENDLKTICDAIPVTSDGDVSTQAHNILLGLNGQSKQFILGGDQPQLYPVPLRQGFNKVLLDTTKTADLNGGFATLASITAKIDGVTVPITDSAITYGSESDGKTLVVDISRDKFESNKTELVLTYIDPTGFPVLSITFNTQVSNRSLIFGVLCDVQNKYDWHIKYLLGDFVPNGSLYYYTLVYNIGSQVHIATQLPVCGAIAQDSFTISSTGMESTTSIVYPVARHFWKSINTTQSDIDKAEAMLGKLIQNPSLPSGYNYGASNVSCIYNARITNLDTQEYFDAVQYSHTLTMSGTVLNSVNYTTTPDVDMSVNAGDRIGLAVSFAISIIS